MTPGWRSMASAVLLAALALGAFAGITHGFAAVTSDGVRRADIARAPRVLPDLRLIDADGRSLSLSDYGNPSTAVTFVNLVYVRCQSVCQTSAAGQSWLQAETQARGLASNVRLLTLSFDPANDTPQVLAEHARRLGANMDQWRFATVRYPSDLPSLLKVFDVVVLPDGMGGYSHNAALFLVGEDGRLRRAYDVNRPDLALADYLRTAHDGLG